MPTGIGRALEAVVSPWGAIFISVGVLLSVLRTYLAWSLIAPRSCSPRRTGNRVPAKHWLTNILRSLFIVSTCWSRDAFKTSCRT